MAIVMDAGLLIIPTVLLYPLRRREGGGGRKANLAESSILPKLVMI